MVIGVTGGIGAGKTTVSKILEELGASVIDVDALGHTLLVKGTPVYDEVIDTFGTDILRKDGSIDRKKLGRIVFADENELLKLNAITHKHLVRLTRERISSVLKDDPGRIIVIDAAVLIEGGFLDLVDKVIVVHADREIRIQRLVAERNFSFEDAVQRIEAQRSDEEWLQFGDFVIDNSGDLEKTRAQVMATWESL